MMTASGVVLVSLDSWDKNVKLWSNQPKIEKKNVSNFNHNPQYSETDLKKYIFKCSGLMHWHNLVNFSK